MSAKWPKGSGGPAGDEAYNHVAFAEVTPFDTTQITSPGNYSRPKPGDPVHPLAAGAHPPAVAFSCRDHGADATQGQAGGNTALAIGENVVGTLHGGSKHGGRAAVATRWAVRRLTPLECERLQGFPDRYTDVPYRRRNWTPDGPRYKALGNSMAVNAMEWIGRRIELVRSL